MASTKPVKIKAQPRRSILSDETYSMIRAMIFAHEILPGERVNIDALALQLGVSQTPIREALARLESEDLIAKEQFREDLYYRINVFPVYIPSLRERINDIPVLTDFFIDKFNKRWLMIKF